MTPFTLAGAMAPVTLAGALAEQNAEALAGMTLTQVVRPGAPVVYGGFTSNVDMQSGAPAFGTPGVHADGDGRRPAGAALQRARIGRRTSRPPTRVDAQAAYESVFSLWGAVMGGVNLMMHGAGWMEGGLHAGFEKVILDAELLGMVEAFLDRSSSTRTRWRSRRCRRSGRAATSSAPPHTQSRFRTAFHKPMLSDWRNYESWEEAGSPQAPAQGERDLEGAARRLRAAADGPARREELAGVRRPPQGRGRRPDRLLTVGLVYD